MRILHLAAVVAVFTAQTAMASGATCSLDAWSADKDPKGLNVRAAPSAGSGIVAVLPPPENGIAVEMHVIASQNGWFEINHAEFADYPGEVTAKKVFEGHGWVFGDRIGFLVNDAKLRDGPDADSKTIANLLTDSSGPDSFNVLRVLDCKGDRAKVDGVFAGKTLHGWVSNICSNQVTTCP